MRAHLVGGTMRGRIFGAVVALLGLALTGCGGGGLEQISNASQAAATGSAAPGFSTPQDLARRIGCAPSFEERDGDIGFPQYMKQYGRCDVGGHYAFLTIYRKAGDPARLRAANPPQVDGLDHWVAGDTWDVEVPEAKPGEIARLAKLLGDPDAQVKE